MESQIQNLSSSEVKELDGLVREHIAGGGQLGSGIFKRLIKRIKKGRKKVQKKLVDAGKKAVVKGIETAAGCKNKRTDGPYGYKKKPNESKHQTFVDKDGCLYSAAWSGAGTMVLPKIAELWAKHNGNVSEMVKSSMFVNPIDRVAMLHDLSYLLAGDAPDKETKNRLIREADEHFIKRLSAIKNDKINVTIPLNAMKAKILLEKSGGPVYAGNEPIKSEEQRTRAKQLIAALKQVGAGKEKKKAGKYDAVVAALRGGKLFIRDDEMKECGCKCTCK